MRIMVSNLSATGAQLPHDGRDRRLTLVRDVRLVRHTEQQHRRTIDRLGLGVEQLCRTAHDVAGHPIVDLLSQLHKAERVAALLRHLVREIVRVDRYAVPTDTGAGIERMESEWLC